LAACLLPKRSTAPEAAAPTRRYSTTVEQLNVLSKLATWPWPKATKETIHAGVTHWTASDADDTRVELFEFDFKANPALRLELFDQDQDDEKPFDNKVEYAPRGVSQITRQLNEEKQGTVVAAWNGSFFGYSDKARRFGFHIAPVVLNGKVHDWKSNHRWTFGVKYKNGLPTFKSLHLPSDKLLAEEFDWAAGGVQCLLLNGTQLKLQPFPKNNEELSKPPIKSTPQDAGHIPLFDHMKSSRVSWGWSNDSRRFYLLYVSEPDTEGASIAALLKGVPQGSAAGKGGWMVADIQRFWQALKVPNAINSDAGGAAQLVHLRRDGKYDLVPPRAKPNPRRMTFDGEFQGAPRGGAMMYFYVRDTTAK